MWKNGSSVRPLGVLSWSVLAASLLPVAAVVGASIPFGLIIIAHGIVFTLTGGHRLPIHPDDIRLLIAGMMLHTVAVLTFAPDIGHGMTLSAMAFACLLYELQGIASRTPPDSEKEIEDLPKTLRVICAALGFIVVPLTILILTGIVIIFFALALMPLGTIMGG